MKTKINTKSLTENSETNNFINERVAFREGASDINENTSAVNFFICG